MTLSNHQKSYIDTAASGIGKMITDREKLELTVEEAYTLASAAVICRSVRARGRAAA